MRRPSLSGNECSMLKPPFGVSCRQSPDGKVVGWTVKFPRNPALHDKEDHKMIVLFLCLETIMSRRRTRRRTCVGPYSVMAKCLCQSTANNWRGRGSGAATRLSKSDY